MSLSKRKATSPGRRHARRINSSYSTLLDEDTLNAKRKQLTQSTSYNAGKNSRGVKTSRKKGGRVKRNYRIIDFKRDKQDIEATVVAIEYDPNRTADIAMLKYEDGEHTYILAPEKLELGDKVISSSTLKKITPGNAYPLKVIPPATYVHNVELVPGKGGVMGRSAGTSIQIQGMASKGYVQLKMPSGEIRLVKGDCYATIGTIGNTDHINEKYGKAGVKRKKGIRPIVRGVAQSWKHPHAGGQGKSGRTGTGRPPKDPWGNKRGKISRKNKKTNKYIIKRRTSKLRPRNKKYKNIS
jgi:large subunit ribosomal protein L2